MPVLNPIELVTPRLKLRWMDERDIDAHYAVFSDPLVTRFWSGAAWTDRDEAVQSMAAIQAGYADHSAVKFGIELRATGELIGNAGLHHFFGQNRRCEMGYALGSRHWGQGYAGEALRALLGYGFAELDLNRVEADIDPRNDASGRVLEKLGFKREGYMPQRWFVHGEFADTVFYGLLRQDWKG